MYEKLKEKFGITSRKVDTTVWLLLPLIGLSRLLYDYWDTDWWTPIAATGYGLISILFAIWGPKLGNPRATIKPDEETTIRIIDTWVWLLWPVVVAGAGLFAVLITPPMFVRWVCGKKPWPLYDVIVNENNEVVPPPVDFETGGYKPAHVAMVPWYRKRADQRYRQSKGDFPALMLRKYVYELSERILRDSKERVEPNKPKDVSKIIPHTTDWYRKRAEFLGSLGADWSRRDELVDHIKELADAVDTLVGEP